MAEHSRYSVSDKEAGVDENGILLNKFGIKNKAELDNTEAVLFSDAYSFFHDKLARKGLRFDLALLFKIHEYCFETLYEWAGKPRRVNIAKDQTTFAPVQYLPAAIAELEKIFVQHLPTKKDTKKQVAEKIAIMHNEYNFVHPFREGNGRIIRLFLDLLVTDLGLPPISWNTKDYMQACREGMAGNHARMTKLILRSIA